ncbi:MAG: C40 family peptidase [Hyphomonadaceae bacterium]
MSRDARLTPARADIAAAHLKGTVDAARFVEGAPHQTIVPAAALRETQRDDARLETQILFGETFIVYDARDGWSWGQNAGDGYVGYVRSEAFATLAIAPTHRVNTLRTIAFAAPDVKAPPLFFLSLNAKVTPDEVSERFVRVARGGWMIGAHLDPIDAHEDDFVAVAERFAGTPYLWGGKDSLGIDCSGLVQTSLERAGRQSPRDSDMQEEALGRAIPLDFSALQRGDLVFWDGHVGIMRDAARLLHANAHHMKVESEPLEQAMARIEPIAGPVRTIRRL